MLKMRVDSKELDRLLKQWPDQARFATSLAINETMKVAQRDQRAHNASAFAVRNSRFMSQAIKIKPFSTKTSLSGVIRIDPPGGQARADILIKFEKGGTKRPRGRDIAVPGRGVKRTSRGVQKSLRPRTVLGAGKAFVGKTRTGTKAIFQRVGSGKRTRVKYLYSLVPRARIQPRLEFVRTVSASFSRHIEPELLKAWKRAVASAR